jgi:hypothetical protein
MSTPANGPTSEYGRYSTAKAAAPAAGLGNVGRVEEHVRADPGGDDAVAGLRDQPGGEQPPEVPLGQHDAQVAEERRPWTGLPAGRR